MNVVKRRLHALLLALLVFVSAFVMGAANSHVAYADGDTSQSVSKVTVSDPSTLWNWSDYEDNDTSNIGRVWTDKTVFTGDASVDGITIEKGDADFLTGLSAISSSSNLRSSSPVPVDIVLVLDASGSMNDPMSRSDRTKRIEALQTAAKAFLDEVAKQNEGVGTALQYQVSLVKFAGEKINSVGNESWNGSNYSQVMMEMTACTKDNVQTFKDLVGNIKPGGATNAKAGLELAKDQTSQRKNAKKLVIFFTDGTPTTSDRWSDSVASGAVAAANSMKTGGATIYSIGIFSGADTSAKPEDWTTSNENKFMQAVSSNYPKATYELSDDWWFPSYVWNFGTRATDSKGANTAYYKTASDTTELSKVFDEIGKAIVNVETYPTQTTDGASDSSGYITFEDELGAYMELTDLSKLVYNGTVYSSVSKTSAGNVDTYTFTGQITEGSSVKDLSKLLITVTRSSDLATGDKVQVKIPASLIPQRHFSVDLTKNSMAIEDATPITVFYSSSVKSGVLDLIANPDAKMKAYMAANTDADTGDVQFYANAWSGNSTGDVTATFDPSVGNSHYYFTTDEPLYTDSGLTARATTIDASETYYYKHEYYTQSADGKPVLATEAITLSGATAAAYKDGAAIGSDTTGCFVKSGTPRFDFINSLYSAKSENTTKTASDAVNPQWKPAGSVAATTLVSYLGNNGKLTVGQTVTLSGDSFATGTKTLTGRDMLQNESFGFTLMPDDTATQTAIDEGKVTLSDTAAVVSGAKADDATAFNFGTASFTQPGVYTFTIAESSWNGADLPEDGTNGMSFDRHEATVTVTVAVDKGKLTASAAVKNGSFTNAYQSSLSYTAEGSLSVAKTLNGRDMGEGQFSIKITPKDSDTATAQEAATALGIPVEGKSVSTPAANDGEQSVVDVLSGSDIMFTQANAGKSYAYEIAEEGSAPNGYTYDTAVRNVVITVTDDSATAALTATTTVTGGSEGDKTFTYPLAEGSTDVAIVPFANSYSASTDVAGGAKATVNATKKLTGRDLNADEFKFGVHLLKSDADVLTASNAADGSVNFGELSYSTESLAELVEAGNATKGVTDGKPSWTVSYVMYEDTTNLPEGVNPVTQPYAFTVSVVDNGDGSLTATTNVPANGFVFENDYNAESASVQISGLKKLDYAAGLNPDNIEGKFTFTISSDDKNAPLPEVNTATNDVSNNVKFDKITFTLKDLNNALNADDASSASAQSGSERSYTFVYNITESGTVAGVVNDDSAKTVEVKVTDDGKGHLSAEVLGDSSQPNFTFNNKYSVEPVESSVTDQLSVSKVLTGRDLVSGEFTFELAALGDAGYETLVTGTNDANGEVTFTPIRYTEPGTYNYLLRETNGGKVIDGVTYDDTAYSITTTVADDGQGGLTVTHKLNSGVAEAKFANEYKVEGTSATIGASKVLTGAQLQDGQFSFILNGADGTKLTKTNDANGAISFALDYDKAGTYEYTISEMNDGQKNVTYDDSTYGVTVEVSESKGALVADVQYADGSAPVFTNAYDEPAPTPDPEPGPAPDPEPDPAPDPDSGSDSDSDSDSDSSSSSDSKDSDSGSPDKLAATGDSLVSVIAPVLLIVAAAVAMIAGFRLRKRI